MRTRKSPTELVDATADVDALMAQLRHPLKIEIAAVRTIIRRANAQLGERVKWNAPAFFYKHDMAAFNLHARDVVHLVFLFPDGRVIADPHRLLEGEYEDRRMVYFTGLADVEAKAAALTDVVNAWVRLVGGELPPRSPPTAARRRSGSGGR